MIVYCKVQLRFPVAHSLKDKRNLLNSLKDKLQNNYNIAVAEIAGSNFCKKATLGLVSINKDFVYLEKVINRIIEFIDCFNGVQLVNYCLEYI